jgi:CheY-like chemotaxis protein
MRIFILEDSPYRIENFKQMLIGHAVDVATTVDEAKAFLDIYKYDLMFLDHDLGGQIIVKSGKGTGYEVAKYIKNTANAEVPTILHSCNPAGAKNMQGILPHAELRPYVSLDIRDIVDSF